MPARDDAPRPAAVARATPPGDPLVGRQWHLDAIGVAAVWPDYTGAGVLVAVIDDGVQGNHPDLRASYDPTHAYDYEFGVRDGGPVRAGDNHGTAVAGLIAAAAGNGIGGAGVAFGASVTSYRALFPGVQPEHEAAAFADARRVDIANNSYGYAGPGAFFLDDFLGNRAFQPVGRALEEAVRDGRDGLGTVFVFAAGNERESGDNVNYHNLANSRFTIVVAASDRSGFVADYGNPGAALLVTAPGGRGDIVTTDRAGPAGYVRGDAVTNFSGTSAATPIVSGVVALMLEANPGLGYRDVQAILAYSARLTGDPSAYQTNGAGDWNGGGLHVSHDYGFGLVDARAAVRLAETWTAQSTLANEASRTAAQDFGSGRAIPDGGGSLRVDLAMPALEIDHVGVTVDFEHPLVGDLVLALISPAGTRSVLLDRPPEGPRGSPAVSGAFAFSSALHRGEVAAGAWTLEVRDVAVADQGALRGWTLTLYGDAPDPNDTYVYTDAYAAHAASDPGRAVLRDGGGVDTLNAAALTGDAAIDLRPGATSTLAGAPLAIAPGTVIERAYGGDGDDVIRGGFRGNILHGMRGDDRLLGAGGNDVLRGGDGDDLLYGQDGDDRLFGEAGNDVLAGNAGDDRLFGGPGDDRLRGGIGDDVLSGQAGRDHLSGEGGSDRVLGGPGDDVLDGGSGDDHLFGGPGDDVLRGGVGADALTGGPGNDVLTGGPGPDVFRFVVLGQGVDRITDFRPGADVLDLGDLLAGTDAATDPARFVDLLDGVDTTVRVDPSGGGRPVPLVVLEGLVGIDLDDLGIGWGGPVA